MNETNRLILVLLAAAWIVAMVTVIFLTWAAPDRTIVRLGDLVEFLNDNNTDVGQLIVSLAAATMAALALLVIIAEFAPEDEPRELRVEQAGATTIIPSEALRLRLEEALLALPEVTGARSHVRSRDKGIAASLDLTVTPTANIGELTQQAVRVVVDTVHTDLGLAVAGMPKVKIAFGGSKTTQQPPADHTASSTAASPSHADAPSAWDETAPDKSSPS